jgi:hypothetical protein
MLPPVNASEPDEVDAADTVTDVPHTWTLAGLLQLTVVVLVLAVG